LNVVETWGEDAKGEGKMPCPVKVEVKSPTQNKQRDVTDWGVNPSWGAVKGQAN